MPEENNCPKPTCGRPESTHRWSAGKKLSICGNGHSWDAQAVADQRAKAKEAASEEVGTGYAHVQLRPHFRPGDPYTP